MTVIGHIWRSVNTQQKCFEMKSEVNSNLNRIYSEILQLNTEVKSNCSRLANIKKYKKQQQTKKQPIS